MVPTRVMVGLAIKRRREELGLKPVDLASRARLSLTTISRIERGADTTLGTLQAIAAALETTIAKLTDTERVA